MIWVSHIAVGAGIGKVFGLNYPLVILGSILPDLVEFFSKRLEHRGLSHSLIIAIVLTIALWMTPLKAVMLGVLLGHLFMDSLTITGIPLWDEKGRRITLFGGRIRTGSAGEFVVSGLLVALCFLLIGSFNLSMDRRDWSLLYHQGVIDKREYYEHRFKFF